MAQAGYVYVVHGVGTNFIKIGKSANFLSRLESIENGVPFAMQILSVQLVHDADKAEQDLLQRYAQYRTRGEWFALPAALLAEWPIDPDSPVVTEQYLQAYPPRLAEAITWLEQALASSKRLAADLFIEAEAVGLTEKALRRAKEALKVRAMKETGSSRGQWYWQLPNTEASRYGLDDDEE
jgi:hypothetical protein